MSAALSTDTEGQQLRDDYLALFKAVHGEAMTPPKITLQRGSFIMRHERLNSAFTIVQRAGFVEAIRELATELSVRSEKPVSAILEEVCGRREDQAAAALSARLQAMQSLFDEKRPQQAFGILLDTIHQAAAAGMRLTPEHAGLLTKAKATVESAWPSCFRDART